MKPQKKLSIRKDVAKKNCCTEKQMGDSEEMKRFTNRTVRPNSISCIQHDGNMICERMFFSVVVKWIHSKIVWWRNREHMRLDHIGRNGVPANGRRYNMLPKHFFGTKCQIIWHNTQNTWKLVCFFFVLMIKETCEFFFSFSSVWLKWTVSMNQ